MTLSDLRPRFQDHGILEVEYLKKRCVLETKCVLRDKVAIEH